MKIGILTYHWVANFGANLQTLSTFNYITKNGHEAIIINWIPSDLEQIYIDITPDSQIREHQQFANQYFVTTKICRNEIEIADIIREYSINFIIIGSDTVFTYKPFFDRIKLCRKGLKYWKPAIDSDFPNPYWGNFIDLVPNIPVAVMSASAQNTKYKLITSGKRKKMFEKALEKFCYISVRDIWTKKMINYLTQNHINPKITPDPVFAFNQNNPIYLSKEYIQNKFKLSEKYILMSAKPTILNEKWVKEIESKFEKKGIILVELPKPQGTPGLSLDRKILLPLSPIDWYYLIKYSNGYIGELMHPIIVCLHNAVPFFSIDYYGYKLGGNINPESSKIYQILSKFDLVKNYYSLIEKKPFPGAEKIFSLINDFDQQKCLSISTSIYEEYASMMEELFKCCIDNRK